MSRYEKEHESIRKSIDDIAGQIDNYVKAFSSEETLNKEIRYYRKCKRVCRFISIVVLAVCGSIIYFHIWG